MLQFGRVKNHESPPQRMFKKINFLVWKLRLGRQSTRCNRKFQENFSYTANPRSVRFQTFCIISSILFSFKLLLVSLPTLPPTLQQINITWPMMWSTLHVSLYRKALCITTIGDGRRGRERRGILKFSVVFRALNNKPSKFFRFIKQPVVLSQTQIWKIEKKVSAL